MLTRLLSLLKSNSPRPKRANPHATLSEAERHWQQYLLQREREEEARLKRQGLDTLPNLLQAIHDDDSRIRREAVSRIADKCQELVSSGDATEEVRIAVSAMASLLKTDDECVHHNVGAGLARTGHPRHFMADVIDATSSQFLSARRAAVACLARLEEEAIAAAPVLLRLLEDPDESLRVEAVDVLGGIGPSAAEAVPALISALNSPATAVRSAAAKALGGIGSRPEVTVPALIHALDNAENYLEPGANASMFPDPNEFSMDPPAIHWRPAPVHFVVGALRHFPAAAVAAVPDLVRVLRYDDQLLRGLCLITLGRIGHPDAVPAILEVLSEPSVRDQASETLSAVREEAIHALGAIGPAAGDATPILMQMLGEPNLFAVDALARIGRSAQSAVTHLLVLLRGEDRRAAVAAAAALRSICQVTSESLLVLQRVITDQDVDVATRLNACALLLEFDATHADAVVPILLQLADRSDFAVRMLGRCGPAAEQAIPWLEAAISRMRGDAEHSLEPRSAEWKLIDTGLAAAVALSQIRQDVSTVLPMLVDMLSDKSPFTRGRAASVLGTLGPAGHDALPALRVRIDDSDRNVRRCASRAIGWIEDGAEHRPAKPPPMRPSGHTRFSFFVWPLSRGF